jgi:DNA processing protein
VNRTEAFIALNLLPKIGPVRVRRLLEVFGSPEAALAAKSYTLERIDGFGPELARTVAGWEKTVDLSRELKRIDELDLTILTQDDEEYPTMLRRIHTPPVVLYVRGQLLPRDRHALAVVGSRNASPYGMTIGRKMGFQLAHAGYTVISGLARGVDTAAHEGALAAKGRTVAVMGSGMAQLYPPENEGLAERIAQSGAIVTEFPVDYPPDRQSFPLRNRIVAGWCQGVVVCEAPVRSGSLITATQAAEYGRTVYAVPGNVDRPSYMGCNRLIQDGAKLVIDAGDVLDDLSTLQLGQGSNLRQNARLGAGAAATQSTELPGATGLSGATPALDLAATTAAPSPAPTPVPVAVPVQALSLSPEEQALISCLSEEPQHINDITQRVGLATASVATTLMRLEMKRLVRQHPGQRYGLRTATA